MEHLFYFLEIRSEKEGRGGKREEGLECLPRQWPRQVQLVEKRALRWLNVAQDKLLFC